jgi:hypothetical protein
MNDNEMNEWINNDKSINLDGLHFAFRLLSSSSLNPSTKASFTHMNEAEMNKCIFYSYE